MTSYNTIYEFDYKELTSDNRNEQNSNKNTNVNTKKNNEVNTFNRRITNKRLSYLNVNSNINLIKNNNSNKKLEDFARAKLKSDNKRVNKKLQFKTNIINKLKDPISKIYTTIIASNKDLDNNIQHNNKKSISSLINIIEKYNFDYFKDDLFIKQNKEKNTKRSKSTRNIDYTDINDIKNRLNLITIILKNVKSKSNISYNLLNDYDYLNTCLIKETNNKQKDKDFRNYIKSKISKQINTVFGKPWSEEVKEIKKKSLYNNFSSYKLKAFIVKGGDDLRQEIIIMQLIKKFKEIFDIEKTNVFLYPYDIIVTSNSSGFLGIINRIYI